MLGVIIILLGSILQALPTLTLHMKKGQSSSLSEIFFLDLGYTPSQEKKRFGNTALFPTQDAAVESYQDLFFCLSKICGSFAAQSLPSA